MALLIPPDLAERYDVEQTVEYIVNGGYRSVALQFPDDQLADSPAVSHLLQERLGDRARVFILADTAYNPLAVDEVAAQHLAANCVVHYGRASLSPVNTLPAFFVFPKHPLDVPATAAALRQAVHEAAAARAPTSSSAAAPSSSSLSSSAFAAVVVLLDQAYQHKLPELRRELLPAPPVPPMSSPSHLTEGGEAGKDASGGGAGGATQLPPSQQQQQPLGPTWVFASPAARSLNPQQRQPQRRKEQAQGAAAGDCCSGAAAVAAPPAPGPGDAGCCARVTPRPCCGAAAQAATAAAADVEGEGGATTCCAPPSASAAAGDAGTGTGPHPRGCCGSGGAGCGASEGSAAAADVAASSATATGADQQDVAAAGSAAGGDDANASEFGGGEGSDRDGATCHSMAGLRWRLPAGAARRDCLYVWVGPAGSAAHQVLQLTHGTCEWLSYDPAEAEAGGGGGGGGDIVRQGLSDETRRLLKRRNFLVERVRAANIVGLLVGTLGSAGFLQVISCLRRMAVAAGKKTYTFLMGKPNPAKLGNFPEVDVFVCIAESTGLLLDCRDYLAPLVSPWEAAVAMTGGHLDPEDYRMEMGDVLELEAGWREQQQQRSKAGQANADEEEDNEGGGGMALTALGGLSVATRGSAGAGSKHEIVARSAAEFLALKRSFRGLEMPATGASPKAPELAVEGLSGRAAVYSNEGA